MVSLAKGQTVRLEKSGGGTLTRVMMGVGWDVRKPQGGLLARLFGDKGEDIDLDASCLLFDGSGTMQDAVWFRQLKSKDGSIAHSGDNLTGGGDGDDEMIHVDLTRLPREISALIFTVNSFRGDSFDRIENAFCRLVDTSSGKEIARYDLSGSGAHTGQVMARVSRDGSGWSMTAIGARTEGRTFHDMMPQIRDVL